MRTSNDKLLEKILKILANIELIKSEELLNKKGKKELL